jgi:hypothetical protein
MFNLEQLHDFLLAAKGATYIGDGEPTISCRLGSHDLAYEAGDYRYLDSYFGGSDFMGEEIVYQQETPVWGMNYYGKLLKPDMISPEEVGRMLKVSLSLMYDTGRFLGWWSHTQDELTYHDTSQGSLGHFSGREWIEKNGQTLYELVYHGGLIK